MSAKEAQAMCQAARKNERKLMVAQCQRFRPDVQLLKKMIDAGELGEIYYSRVWTLRRRGFRPGVFIEKDKQGGGPMIDIGVHMLDMALYLMGHPKPVAVSGKCYTKFGTRKGVFNPWGEWDPKSYTVEDYAAGFVRFDNWGDALDRGELRGEHQEGRAERDAARDRRRQRHRPVPHLQRAAPAHHREDPPCFRR